MQCRCSRSIDRFGAKPPARFLLLGSTTSARRRPAAPFLLRLLPKPSRCARLRSGRGIGRGGFPESGRAACACCSCGLMMARPDADGKGRRC
jgi:hypothetical protein